VAETGSPLEVVDLGPAEIPEGVGVCARGMRDNPLHVAAFGPDPERRVRALTRLFASFFSIFEGQEPFGLRRDAVLVAATGVGPPGCCPNRPTAGQRLRLTPTVLGLGPRTAARTSSWMKVWADRDPDEPHSHLGPLAVDAHLQGQGIGTVLLAEYCRRLDAAGQTGYLETDRPENVRFYERGGFEVIGEAEAIGVPNWFMRREPQPAGPSSPGA
jgi:ribosomal protein S18 acetylase RimI-like enzyme